VMVKMMVEGLLLGCRVAVVNNEYAAPWLEHIQEAIIYVTSYKRL